MKNIFTVVDFNSSNVDFLPWYLNLDILMYRETK